jgi:hypothetical protein
MPPCASVGKLTLHYTKFFISLRKLLEAMKKEIGKWFMDIAKYVATAILISSFLGGFNEKWLMYVVGAILVTLCFTIGLGFIHEKK